VGVGGNFFQKWLLLLLRNSINRLRDKVNPTWSQFSAVSSMRLSSRPQFRAQRENSIGGAGDAHPPHYLSTLILAFSQREKESIYYLSELTT